jgi:lipoprotein-anchoring transpeptidase ErfK/SrfK
VDGVLGRYRLRLDIGVDIHGTRIPTSVGHAVTHGCIRALDEDMEWLFDRVPIGTRVFIF